jgi:hypothetical protein
VSNNGSYQVISRYEGDQQEILYWADECDHVQWVKVLEAQTGMDSVHCETCNDYGIRRTWRKAMVEV